MSSFCGRAGSAATTLFGGLFGRLGQARDDLSLLHLFGGKRGGIVRDVDDGRWPISGCSPAASHTASAAATIENACRTKDRD